MKILPGEKPILVTLEITYFSPSVSKREKLSKTSDDGEVLILLLVKKKKAITPTVNKIIDKKNRFFLSPTNSDDIQECKSVKSFFDPLSPYPQHIDMIKRNLKRHAAQTSDRAVYEKEWFRFLDAAWKRALMS
jgi:hypothetical protein